MRTFLEKVLREKQPYTLEKGVIYDSVVLPALGILQDVITPVFNHNRIDDDLQRCNLDRDNIIGEGKTAFVYGLSVNWAAESVETEQKDFYEQKPILRLFVNENLFWEGLVEDLPERNPSNVVAGLTVDSISKEKGYLDITSFNPITGESEPRIINGNEIVRGELIFTEGAYAGTAGADLFRINLECLIATQRKIK